MSQVKAGTFFVSSWGYEQTNVDFYRVVSSTTKTVTLQRVQPKIVSQGCMIGQSVPSDQDHPEAPFRRTLKDGNRVKLTSYSSAFEWNGKPQSFSSYA